MPKFDANELSKQVISSVMWHMTGKFLNQLWFVSPDMLRATSSQPHPLEQSPLREQIEALCRVANGEIDRASADEYFVGEVVEMMQSLMETLYSHPLENSYDIPAHFWQTQLGQVVAQSQLWLENDTLITLTEAAQILRGGSEQKDLVYVNDLIKRGSLTRYVAPDEPNPQHAGRVSRKQVEAIAP